MRYVISLVTIFTFSLISCNDQSSSSSATSKPIIPAWLQSNETPPYLLRIHGEATLGILKNPDRVESFRVEAPAAGSSRSADAYRIVKQGPALVAKQIAEAVRMTTRMESFVPGMAKACGFNPDLVLQFNQGDKQVTVVICFSCSEWYFILEGKSSKTGISYAISMDATQRDLLKLARELFPDDDRFKQVKANPQQRYSKGYLTPVAAPMTDENANADIEMRSVEVLAKYIPTIKGKISNWSNESMSDIAYAIDGVLFVYTTKENHDIIVSMDGVKVLP